MKADKSDKPDKRATRKKAAELTNQEAAEKLFGKRVVKRIKQEVSE